MHIHKHYLYNKALGLLLFTDPTNKTTKNPIQGDAQRNTKSNDWCSTSLDGCMREQFRSWCATSLYAWKINKQHSKFWLGLQDIFIRGRPCKAMCFNVQLCSMHVRSTENIQSYIYLVGPSQSDLACGFALMQNVCRPYKRREKQCYKEYSIDYILTVLRHRLGSLATQFRKYHLHCMRCLPGWRTRQ